MPDFDTYLLLDKFKIHYDYSITSNGLYFESDLLVHFDT